jgi:DNA mismatch repair ATPase MutS
MSTHSKDIYSRGSFDIALAYNLTKDAQGIVTNDFELSGHERIIIVSGPNQGGKTTFARTFGQLHHFASLGCCVAGSEAKLYLPDQILTHFECEEHVDTLSGKLQDDLIRIHDILSRATGRSIIIINEILASTSLKDGVLIGKRLMDKIIDMDSICVCVTFLVELATYKDRSVSMVSKVVPDDPSLRTFKIVRQPADGLAYATFIASKYGLTYENIKERIQA